MMGRILILGLCALLAVPFHARAQEAEEYDLKVAFLYNFALFTEWPPDGQKTFNVCVTGRDPFGPALDELEAKTIRERRIAVVRGASGDALRTCHVLFVPGAERPRLAQIAAATRGGGVLTVTENAKAGESGAVINLLLEKGRIVFEINLEAARRARLAISSKLLRLARSVQGE